MHSGNTVDEYILNAKYGREILLFLREILKTTPLTETIKWGGPVYTFKDKNIVAIGSFKSYVALWFYQGALLKDEAGVLINAQEEVTKALRQWRFTSTEEINEPVIINYINQSLANLKQGKEIKPNRNKPIRIPEELQDAFAENPELKKIFFQFLPGKQREFAEYILEAKRKETRLARLEKVIPLIMQKTGLNDKYRKQV